ncbi:IS3 family transposase [Lysinibacillus sp. RS5]|uniref:IS3 family transposase n=1 Tax=unclassified Lysinibacillus TaxID=2636778 RepID=UPI0035BE90DF
MRFIRGGRKAYSSFESLKLAVDGYIHYYNNTRIKNKLKCSPVQYREKMAT